MDYDPLLWQLLEDALGEQHYFVADHPLPKSVRDEGFTDEDFHPNRNWPVGQANRSRYEGYPAELEDIHIFNGNPHCIAYENILRLPTKYTNREIFTRCNQNRPTPAFQAPTIIDSRVKAAVVWTAKGWQADVDDVWAWLVREKQKNGVRVPLRKRKREDDE